MTKFREWLRTISILVILGAILTFTYFGYLIQIYGNDLIKIKTMPLNEVGDFLAGVFGPVAFLWLVIGYLMQHFELKLSRSSIEKQTEELELTRQTLEQQLIEYQESVKLTQMSYEFHQSFQTKLYKESIEPHQPRTTDFSVEIVWNNPHGQFTNSLTAFHIKAIIISFINTGAIADNCSYHSRVLGGELKRIAEESSTSSLASFGPPSTKKIRDSSNQLILDYTDLKYALKDTGFTHNQDEGELLDTIELNYTDAKNNSRTLNFFIFSHMRVNHGLILSVTTQNNNPFEYSKNGH